jgi:hypothetical protein
MTPNTPDTLETRLTEHDHRWVTDTNCRTVYHVGNLDVERVIPHHSQEGMELSIAADRTVSDAWKRIARLDGTTYELTNSDACFYHIDPHTSVTDVETNYCRENNYISVTTGYRVDNYDGDRYMLFYDRDRAGSEAAGITEDATIEETSVPMLADRGQEYWSEAFRQSCDEASPVGVRMLIPIWTVSTLPVDGVYWHHPLEPYNHCAPRGLIFQDQLDDWTVSKLTD